jgi:hypothetical protein
VQNSYGQKGLKVLILNKGDKKNMFKEYIDYFKDNPQGYWFKAKLFGWGWMPVKWQGWAVIAGYLVLVALFAMTIDDNSPGREVIFTFVLPVLLLTITLIRICYKTGEKPRWQWGIPKKTNGQ